MGRFTPFPWDVRITAVAGSGVAYRIEDPIRDMEDVTTQSFQARHEANRALIAAAPDLLAALQSIMAWTDEPSERIPIERRELMIRNAARAALAKALGRAAEEQG